MAALKGEALKQGKRPTVSAVEALPELPVLSELGEIEDSKTYRECKFFGEAVIRDVASWRHREARRAEGLYCPNVERRARVIASRYHVSLSRARLIASLMGGRADG